MTDAVTFIPKERYGLVEETITTPELAALASWLGTSPRLTQGKKVAEFEAAFAAKIGAKHAIFVNSGSSANLLAWFFPTVLDHDAAAQNRRVVVPAVAWSTSVMPAMQAGFRPVLCEADEETWGLDVAALRRICEKEAPSIVMVVHVLGVPAKMKEIVDLREEFGFLLLEDACGAFGSEPVGKVADITTFSTYYGHQLSTIEGGVVCTNGDAGAIMLRMMRAHGWAADLDEAGKKVVREQAERNLETPHDPFREKFTFYVPGFNVRASDLQAFLGLGQLARADEVISARRKNHQHYFSRFAGAKNFTIQKAADRNPSVASIGFGVLASSRAHRNKVAVALAAKGIETRPIAAGNIGRQPFWIAAYGAPKKTRPIADRIHDCGFQLPNNPSLTREDIDYIADTALEVTP